LNLLLLLNYYANDNNQQLKQNILYKKFQMLKDIILVQPYLSSYYEATKLVIKQRQSSTTNMYFNNKINDNQEEFRLDSKSDNDDNNRKF
jgi:hypothetical protein